MNELHTVCTDLFQALGMVPADIEPMADGVVGYYSMDHRIYHGVDHPLAMREAAMSIGWCAGRDREDLALLTAIVFHDLWWWPGQKGRAEVLSSRACRLVLQRTAVGPMPLIDEYTMLTFEDLVCSAIEYTQHYDRRQAPTKLASRLMDLDLLSLAADWPDFLSNQEGIASEAGVSLKDCSEFLTKTFGGDQPIFQTDAFSKYEQQAKANVERAAEELG